MSTDATTLLWCGWFLLFSLGFVCKHWAYSKMQLTATWQHQEQGLQCILWFGTHRNYSTVLTPLEVVLPELNEMLPTLKTACIHATLEAAVAPRKQHLAVQITIPVSWSLPAKASQPIFSSLIQVCHSLDVQTLGVIYLWVALVSYSKFSSNP